MRWDPKSVISDFVSVSSLAGVELKSSDIVVEILNAPHKQPLKLPEGHFAVYVFTYDDVVLKVGKVGSKSQRRYTYQHYNPRSASSTLANSILKDLNRFSSYSINNDNIKNFIEENIHRVNFLMPNNLGVGILNLFEAFIQCRLQPCYEGFQSQRV